MDRIALAKGECSLMRQHCLLWKSLRKMQVPRTVKVFMWRACINALPTIANLSRRKITQDPFCPLCGLVAETTGHILWECGTTKDVWSLCGQKIQKRSIEHEDFVAIIEILQRDMEPNDMELIVVVARTLWLRRNVVVHGGIFSHPTLIARKALDSLKAYRSANSRQGTHPEDIPITNLSWQGLLEGFVKVN